MATLTEIRASKVIPEKGINNKVIDTGTQKALTTTLVKYTNDAVQGSTGTMTLWNPATNSVDLSMLPVGCNVDVILQSDVEGGNQDASIIVQFICPNNGSPIIVANKTVPVLRAVNAPIEIVCLGVVSAEIQQYGIDIYSATVAGSLNVSNRELLIRAH